MELYWWLRLPQLGGMVEFLTAFGFASLLVGSIMYVAFKDERCDENNSLFRKQLKRILIISICLATIGCFIPTRTDLAIMFGWEGLQSDSVQEVVELLKDKLR